MALQDPVALLCCLPKTGPWSKTGRIKRTPGRTLQQPISTDHPQLTLNQIPGSKSVRSSTCLPPLTKLRELSSRQTQTGHQERMVSLQSCTAGTIRSWKTSTCVLFGLYYEYVGKIMSPTLKFWTAQNPPASNSSSPRPNSHGWGMPSACRNIPSLDTCCMVNLSMAKGTQVDLGSATRTASKPNLHWCKIKPKELDEHGRDRPHWQATVK